MAGAGPVIIFMFFFAGGAIWTLLFVTFTAHYFLTVVIDSSSGNDEVHFPVGTFVEWLWKPAFCLWILAFWVITGGVLLAPLSFGSAEFFVIGLATLVWLMYPVGVLSALYTQNWIFFVHPMLVGRMLRHFGAFTYVHLVSLFSAALCVGLLIGVFTHSFFWAMPTAFVLPTALLFYARHWGRFAWLALNFAPRRRKRRRAIVPPLLGNEDVPELDVEEVSVASEGICAGLPPAIPHTILANTVAPSTAIQASAAPVPAAPSSIAPVPTTPMVNEEEDEWSTNKKPYPLLDAVGKREVPLYDEPEDNKPISLAQYYDEKARQEKEEQKRKHAARNYLPPSSKRTPTFQSALFFGVWKFMLYRHTLRVWCNLVILTIVELFLLVMVRRFFPV